MNPYAIKTHAPQTCLSADSSTSACYCHLVNALDRLIIIRNKHSFVKDMFMIISIHHYINFFSLSLETIPGNLPLLEIGLSFTSLISIVISIAGAPEI